MLIYVYIWPVPAVWDAKAMCSSVRLPNNTTYASDHSVSIPMKSGIAQNVTRIQTCMGYVSYWLVSLVLLLEEEQMLASSNSFELSRNLGL